MRPVTFRKCKAYKRNDRLVVASVAADNAGDAEPIFTTTEPFSNIEVGQYVRSALAAAETLPESDAEAPLRAFGVKTRHAFETGLRMASVSELDASLLVTAWRKERGYWIPVRESYKRLPLDADSTAIGEAVAQSLQWMDV